MSKRAIKWTLFSIIVISIAYGYIQGMNIAQYVHVPVHHELIKHK